MDTTHAFVPFCRPTLEDDEIEEVIATLRSGWITSGPRVVQFEEAFREAVGAPHAVAVNSATAGLHLVLAAAGIGPGDQVVTTSMTWPSTVNCIEHLGARPVFADVDPATLQIDPDHVRSLVTARTRAILPVHFAGQPADLRALREIADGVGALLVEDAAHAVGTSYEGRAIGSGPTPAVFSFHPIKNITTGEGGMVTCHDETLADRLRVLRFHGVSKDAWNRYGRAGSARYEVVTPGWKYNMLDLQAALGLRQLTKVARFNAARAERAERYSIALADVPGVRPLERVRHAHEHAWHLYIVRVDPARVEGGRDGFIAALAARGVGAGLHFTPVHLHRYYRAKYGFRPGSLPHTERAGEEIVSLPLYPLLTPDDQQHVIDAVCDVLGGHRVAV